MDNYEKIKKIGRGTYGDVILVRHKQTQKLMALKKVVLENLYSSSSSGPDTKREEVANSQEPDDASNMIQHGENAQQKIEIMSGMPAIPGDQNNKKLKDKKIIFQSSQCDLGGGSHQSSVSKNSSEETQRALNNEIKILSNLDHANIIKYYESFVYKRHLCIITEYAENGDLQRKIKEAKSKPISQQQILNWFCQLAMAMGHIHSKNILHRDLKPKNIMLTSNDDIKIGDFGISKMLENTFDMAKTATGTPYYLSPEVCLGQKYDNKSDCWMLGCILFELCTLQRPFQGESLNTVLHKITKTDPAQLPKEFDPIFQRLIDMLLQKNAQLRASISEVLDMPQIKQNIAE